ncbi:molybdenum cofactor biosynthesis protein MoeB, partial [Myxococcota bacterium]|nr:molybdenum cofactor biosynthesis protein MoeB [Myxococcota bacterium]
ASDAPPAEPFSRLSVTAAKARLDAGWAPYVLDVRRASEAEIVKLAFADRLQPHTEVLHIADELPRDRDILIHCKLGGRSAAAAQALADAGFDPQRLYNLDGGITAWAQEIDPSLPTY